MDPVSSTFCGAKWFEGTIWLYQGTTASCHHNPFHKIKLHPLNPSSVFHTPEKLADREDMINGTRPKNCSYCWNTEDQGNISDRVIKTGNIKTKVLDNWLKYQPNRTKPELLEIAFERTCNLACAYCGPSFSSKWANEIKQNGPYKNLKTDSRYFTHNSEDMIDGDDNPYTRAFFAWWPQISKDLRCLRITGGEPLLSPNFWRFIDQLGKFNGTLIVNTNLISTKGEVDNLLVKTKKYKLRVHTSLESNLGQAEYVRDGFNSMLWLNNVEKVLKRRSVVLNVTTAINNMAVFSFIDYLRMMSILKRRFGRKRIEINCNFVHYPAFMRVQMLPLDVRKDLADEVTVWLDQDKRLLSSEEIGHVKRFIAVMSEEWIDDDYSLEDAKQDLVSFIKQYDQRRNKDFRKTLDYRFVRWHDELVL
jgi:organic radical activating enzyme